MHGRQILHQDLKPANIFVRSLNPLDIVLGDFGLARNQEVSEQISSTDGTLAYQSPEYALAGRHSAGGDWWALGMILHILLTGNHVYAGEDGRIDQHALRAHLFDGEIDFSAIRDPRWQLLMAGLLTAELRERWGAAEVAAWLAGESPAVHRGSALKPKANRTRAITLLQKSCDTPEQVAAALGQNTSASLQYLRSPAASELANWLRRVGLAEETDEFLLAIREDPAAANSSLVSLQAILDPESSPRFEGRELSITSLEEVGHQAATGDSEAANWIATMRAARVLSGAAQIETHASLAMVDERLRMWWDEFETRLTRVPLDCREQARRLRPQLEGEALAAAVSDRSRRALLKANRALLRSNRLPSNRLALLSTPDSNEVPDAMIGRVLIPILAHEVSTPVGVAQPWASPTPAPQPVQPPGPPSGSPVPATVPGSPTPAVPQTRFQDAVSRLRGRALSYAFLTFIAGAWIAWVGPATALETALPLGIGLAAWLAALFVVDVTFFEGGARSPRAFGIVGSLTAIGWLLARTVPTSEAVMPWFALVPMVGFVVGYATASIACWAIDRFCPPTSASFVGGFGALIAMSPVAVIVGVLLEQNPFYAMPGSQLPDRVQQVALLISSQVPTEFLPGAILGWCAVPVSIGMFWGFDTPIGCASAAAVI